MKKALAFGLALLAVAPLSGAHAARRAPTMADTLRRAIVREARANGFDARTVLRTRMSLSSLRPDGTIETRSMSLAKAILAVGGRMAAPRSVEPGIGGGPEVNVGDVSHTYFNAGFGIVPSYTITTSSTVPATPAVYVAAPLFMEYGGPVVQVKGSNWEVAVHTVGTHYAGSNVDTGMYGPYLPVVDSGAAFDNSIDFTGHALTATQAHGCIPFINFCVAIGLLVGDGLTLFDNTTGVDLPILP